MNLRLHLARHPRPAFDPRIHRNLYHRPTLVQRWNECGARGLAWALIGVALAVGLAWARTAFPAKCKAPPPGWELVVNESDWERRMNEPCSYAASKKVRT